MRVYFKENTHQYFNEEHKEYIAVSNLFKKLKPDIDWDKIARLYGKKHGLSLADVQRLWKAKAEVGTLFHSIRETETITGITPEKYYGVQCSPEQCLYDKGVKWSYPTEKLENNKVYPELIIYDHSAGVSGQSDKVIVTNNTINIWDYKTDESIDFEGFASEWKKPQKYLPPIHHLEVANGNEYCIKMSMYMYMLWKQNPNLKTGEILIEHVTLKRGEFGMPIIENGKPIVLGIKPIKLPYRRNEVKDIFEFYKQGKLNQS